MSMIAKMRTMAYDNRYYADIDDLIAICTSLHRDISKDKLIQQLILWKDGLRDNGR
jgi:hypothetical protein